MESPETRMSDCCSSLTILHEAQAAVAGGGNVNLLFGKLGMKMVGKLTLLLFSLLVGKL